MIFLITIFLASLVLTYLVKVIAAKKMLLDMPNERSSHEVPTPRGGGVAIAIIWFIGISVLHYCNISFLSYEGQLDSNLYYALMSGVLISGISFLDDIYTLKSLPRIIVQSVSAFLALYFIGGFTELDLGFLIVDNPYILNTLAFLAILWFINLFNFIDGINGYSSSGTILIALGVFFFTNDILLLVLTFSILGFLPWNWGKAKIFMGDIGSTLLGFTIAVLLIQYSNTGQFSIINGLILSSIFWFDATYTLIKRFLNKERFTQPHKKHAYQRIVQYGFSHQKTTIIAIILNLGLYASVYFTYKYEKYILLVLGIVIIILFLIYKAIGRKKSFNDLPNE